MKYKNIIIIFALLAAGFSGCNRDEVFEREQYKHVIAVKSEGTFKIFNQDLDLDLVDANGYVNGFIAATVGGSLATEKPIKMNIVRDMDMFNEYNQYSYADQTYLYAKLIPDYIISDYSINIPAGERTGMMRIRVNTTGLSPDTVYMLPFRVNSVSEYEMNMDKSTALYRVYLKNFYSTTRSIPQYTHKGAEAVAAGDQVEVNTMMQKHVHPLTKNSVRVFAGGSQVFDASARDLEQKIMQWAIVLTMDADNKVSITPWNNSADGMKVKQVDAPCDKKNCKICDPKGYEEADEKDRINCHYDPYFSNTFEVFDDGWGRKYKLFRLLYEYTRPSGGATYVMKEELKIDYTPEVQ